MTEPLVPLMDIVGDYPIAPDQAQAYRRDGHVLLRGVLSPAETAAYRPVITSAVMRDNTQTIPLAERDAYGKAFLQVTNLWTRDEGVRRYTLARRFAKIAADLMGVRGVRIYHDQALYKEAGGGITPWHQDQYYWPLDTNHTITMWMPLIDVTPEMGTLVFASGSHESGYLGKLPISPESEAVFQAYVREKGYRLTAGAVMAGGDATFHSGWTLHNAPGNAALFTREAMTIIYVADGARAIEPDHRHRASDLASWLPGCQPGDLAATALNPLVYGGE